MTDARIAALPESNATDAMGDIGARLRQRREQLGLSLREVARRVGVSPSLVSQIETGKARPSVSTLYALVRVIDVPIDSLFVSDAERSGRAGRPMRHEHPDSERGATVRHLGTVHGDIGAFPARPMDLRASPGGKLLSPPAVQRRDHRDTLNLGGGVVWERLTPYDVGDADFLRITYDVGCASCPEGMYQTHAGREFGFVISGRLAVTVGFDTTELEAGDSIYFDSTNPHRLANIGDEQFVGIWVVRP